MAEQIWGLWYSVTHPHVRNYFYLLIVVSLVFWALEILRPWRREQKLIRKDFWLDGFYMFFNLFLFPLLGFYAASQVLERVFLDFLGLRFPADLVLVSVAEWPGWAQLLALFVVRDFAQWWTHRLLHRVPLLWELHKVHHSVEQMGFAAHLRYHWAENIVYHMLEYIPARLLGFGVGDFFIVYAVSLCIGHFNHANFRIPLGPLKYVFNNPEMHIWHHARRLPERFRYGANFGLSLSLWDYLFRTATIPQDGRDIELGFEGLEEFPSDFGRQFFLNPFRRKRGSRPGSG